MSVAVNFAHLSFRTRLLLGAILPALLMVCLLEMVFISRYRFDIEQAFHENGLAVARQIRPAVEYALFTGDNGALRALAEATRASDERIIAVGVLNPGRQTLAIAGQPIQTTLLQGNNLQVIDHEDRTTFYMPVQHSILNGEDTDLWGRPRAGQADAGISGYVVVEISRDQLINRRREMLQITAAIVLSGLLLAGWLSFRIAAGVLQQLDCAATELRRQKDLAEALARTDPLTGMANRRAFDETAQMEIERALRYGKPLALVMTDIDHFKAINDVHGHHVGDRVLQDFTQALTTQVRSIDLVGRWGGEEFVILLPETSLDEARLAAERMRLSVAGAPTRLGNIALGYTASFGVAELHDDESMVTSLLGRADAALYRAKNAGRNRVELADQDLTKPSRRTISSESAD